MSKVILWQLLVFSLASKQWIKMDPKAGLFSSDRLLRIKGTGPYIPMSLFPKSILEIMLTYDCWPSMQLPCQIFVRNVFKAHLPAKQCPLMSFFPPLLDTLSSIHITPKATAKDLA